MVTKIDLSLVQGIEAVIDERLAEMSGGKIDVGDYVISSGTNKPKFLLCNGGAYSRVTYAALFEKIGTSFGAGDGSTTFNVPNAGGRHPLIAGQFSGGTERVAGQVGGAETHKLTQQEIPAHNHSGTAASAGAHTHTGGTGSMNSAEGGSGGSPFQFPQGGATGSSGAHTHTLTINNTGGDQAHNNMPPFVVLGNLFIYAGV